MDVLAASLNGDSANTITHVWNTTVSPIQQANCDTAVPGSIFNTDHCENIFLHNSVEISGDGIGNDNDLCETDETCLYTSNIASYQGQGDLQSAGTLTDGDTITAVTLMVYSINGY